LENAQLLGPNNIQLEFLQTQQQQVLKLRASTVIAATGYQYPAQTFLNKLNDGIVLDTQQRWKISEHHQLQYQGDGEIYIQNTSLQHHGVGTPDLGLGAFRSARIANQIRKENYFDVDGKQGFQDFQLDNQALTTEFQINNSRTNTVMPHPSGKTDDQYLKVMSK
jgi:lysine N6-hydroxylase